MSLRVWLPLISDISDQGLDDLPAPSLNGLSVQSTGGKLGGCYSGYALYHLSSDILNNVWSVATWVKSSSWLSSNDIIACKNSSESTSCQFYFSIINGASLNIGVNGSSSIGSYAYTFANDTWYHVAATYDGSNCVLYINGTAVKTIAVSASPISNLLNIGVGCRSTNTAGTTSTGYGSKYFNDFRVYDHALSALEVKLISRGLVAHYTLNDSDITNLPQA